MIPSPWRHLFVDKSLVCEFVAVFSRLEYALKAAGFASQQGSYAEPDWPSFVRSIQAVFDRNASPELSVAVEYLLTHPPQVQTFVGNALGWRPLTFRPGTHDASMLADCIRCVRNNLFHGGKFLPPPNGRDSRDTLLIQCCSIAIEALLPLDRNVEQAFLN